MDGSVFSIVEESFAPFHPLIQGYSTLQRPRRGIVSGTRVLTETGWCAIEDLNPGDSVQTFDNGMQPIAGIESETLWAEGTVSLYDPLPIVLPAGALRNKADIKVLPHQGILVESENACDAMGDPLAVVPARVLVGINGIDTAPPEAGLEVFTLTFASEEVVYGDGGLMLHCPAVAPEEATGPVEELYDVKTLVEARRLLTDLDIAQLVLDEESFEEYEAAALARVA